MRKEILEAIKSGDTRKFYKSKEWRAKRKDILKRDNNECQKCKSRGNFSKATCVHHKKHLREHPGLALTDNNLESLCDACHNEEHPEKLKEQHQNKRFINEERWE